jgi:hypothetical protein
VRVERRLGIAQAKPESIGTGALAVESAPAEQAVHDERGARHVAAVLEDADEEEQDEDLRRKTRNAPTPPRMPSAMRLWSIG